VAGVLLKTAGREKVSRRGRRASEKVRKRNGNYCITLWGKQRSRGGEKIGGKSWAEGPARTREKSKRSRAGTNASKTEKVKKGGGFSKKVIKKGKKAAHRRQTAPQVSLFKPWKKPIHGPKTQQEGASILGVKQGATPTYN